MIRYILKRILIFLPTLFAISLIAFWLGKVAPGDPVEARFPPGSDFRITGEAYQRMYQQIGLDKPTFYLALSSVAYPDTLYKVPGRYHQQSIAKLIAQYGNWDKIQVYISNLVSLDNLIEDLPKAVNQDKKIEISRAAKMLLEEYKDVRINIFLQKIKETVFDEPDSTLQAQIGSITEALLHSYEEIKGKPTRYNFTCQH